LVRQKDAPPPSAAFCSSVSSAMTSPDARVLCSDPSVTTSGVPRPTNPPPWCAA
jgi:hypothetical protein